MTGQAYQEQPCLRCGACCASFRVSFYWSEAEQRGLPLASVEKAAPLLACMAGTNQQRPLCHGLEGTIGEQVSCRLYEARPSPCREVQPGDAKCQLARARHGLAPLA
jgi:uncharacterized protein